MSKRNVCSLISKLTVLTIVTLMVGRIFVYAPAVYAASKNSKSENSSLYKKKELKTSFGKINDISKSSTEINDSQKLQEIKSLSKKDISSNKVLLNNSNAILNFENTTSLEINEQKQNYTSVVIPVVGEQYSLLSNVTLLYDSKGALVTYSESLITKNDNNKFVITTYAEGILIEKNVTDQAYINNEEFQQGLDNLTDYSNQLNNQRGIGAIAGCVAAVLGVTGTVGLYNRWHVRWLLSSCCTNLCSMYCRSSIYGWC